MKKFFMAMLLAGCSVGASAQATFNVRVGTGLMSYYFSDYVESWTELDFGPAIQMQCNIPLRKYGTWTFSPSVNMSLPCFSELGFQFYVPLEIGKKVATTNPDVLFFPKFGIAAGFNHDMEEDCESTCIFGPSVSLDIEKRHFVMGLNGYFSPIGNDPNYAALLTLGYKF